MPFTRAQYSRQGPNSLRAALAEAIAEALRGATFTDQTGGAVRFARVYSEWPTHVDRQVVPAACVLPNPLRYVEARMTPALLRDTWEPEGQAGFGLYKTSDVEADFEVELKHASSAERDVLLSGVDTLFTASDSHGTDVAGFQPGSTLPRYGLVLPLPGYWGMCGGFWLLGVRTEDNEQSAMREHWRAFCTIRAAAAAVRLGPVQPMKPVVKALFDC